MKLARSQFNWSGDASLYACMSRLRGHVDALRAARWRIAAWCACCTAAALIYCESVPAQYVARVDIVIAPQAIANDGPEDVRHFHQITLDTQQAATELEVLRSERLLRTTFESLIPQLKAELAQGGVGFWSALSRHLQDSAPEEAAGADPLRAYFAFVQRTRSLRLGTSYVFEVSYRSHDPQLAARVANALAAAYLADRIERARLRQERVGGAYQLARQANLTRESRISLAAARGGAAVEGDLFAAAARILGPATPPLAKSYPRLGPTLFLAALIGLLSGALAALAAARRDFDPSA